MSNESKEDRIQEELRRIREEQEYLRKLEEDRLFIEKQRALLQRDALRAQCTGGKAHPYDSAPLGQHVWDYTEWAEEYAYGVDKQGANDLKEGGFVS